MEGNILMNKQIYHHDRDWECGKVRGNLYPVSGHGNPNTHKDSVLSIVNLTNKVRTPILRDWCKDNQAGLEDLFIDGVGDYDWLGAEKKLWYGQQLDMSFFRALKGTNDWKWIFDIKPIGTGFQKKSVSSPTFKFENGVVKVIYEGRRGLTKETGVHDYKIGYLEVNPNTFKISNRSTTPIMSDRLVPDDFEGKISGHRRGTATQDDPNDKWHAVVYKKVDGVWVQDYEPKDQDGRVGEYYFNGYYWKSNKDGLWKVVKDTKPPTNGGNMLNFKVSELPNNRVRFTWSANENVHFEDDVRGYWKTCGIEYGGVYQFENKKNATKFRARQESGAYGNWVKLEQGGGELPVDPPTGDFDKAKVLASVNRVRTELDIIEAEVNKA